MKKLLLMLGLTVAIFGSSKADIKVSLPENNEITSLNYSYESIKKSAEAKTRSERGTVRGDVAVTTNQAIIPIPSDNDNYQFMIRVGEKTSPITFYVTTGDNAEVNISNLSPLTYTLSGTPLLDGMTQLSLAQAPVYAKAESLSANGKPSPEEIEAIKSELSNVQKKFINSNPTGAAAPIALLNLSGEDFISIYDENQGSLQNSILAPIVEKQYKLEKRNVEYKKKQELLTSGNTEAPNFTLKNLEGNEVSLSDFRGKWVILDFWGSWCPWCIKGFPELKEAYEKYSGRLEIIGIDCNEDEAAWKAGVEKYELPWVHVYNPKDSNVLPEYGVRAFPTKAIINPEGIVKNITVGHDPAFFVALTELMGN